jgi:uncharacterized protein (TIGR02271 family)
MSTPSTDKSRDSNPDLITGEPGSHPIGVGLGAAGAGAAGAAIGTAVGGPIGTVVGGILGAVAGGYGGKAVGEVVDPTGEDNYWRESHSRQPYADKTLKFEDYAPAYRTGYEGYSAHAAAKQTFEAAEPDLRKTYEASGAKVPWHKAKEATRAAWTRVEKNEAVRVPVTEEEVKVGKRQVESGSVNIRKEVHTETVNVPVSLKREEIVVDRVSAGQGPVPADAFTEGEIRIPTMREEAVVEKTAKVVGEVRVSKKTETDEELISETIRK